MDFSNRALVAECLGTAWLVFGGCGSAVLAAAFPEVGIGLVGVSLAFGLTVLTMAYAIGPISGCHLNPAVTAGLVVAGRFERSKALGYIVAQVVGAIVAAFLLFIVASGKPGADLGGFAANGFGELSPGRYGALSGLLIELVMTFMFLTIILGATSPKAPAGFAPIAIGLERRGRRSAPMSAQPRAASARSIAAVISAAPGSTLDGQAASAAPSGPIRYL